MLLLFFLCLHCGLSGVGSYGGCRLMRAVSDCSSSVFPLSSFSSASPVTRGVVLVVNTTRFILVSLKGCAGDVWNNCCDVSYCLCPAFPEHHAGAWMKKLWILDETKTARSFISSTKVLSVHGNDRCCLPSAATVNWQKAIQQWNYTDRVRVIVSFSPIAWYLALIVVGWCSTSMSPSNSQQAQGLRLGSTITMPFRIWFLFICKQLVEWYRKV